MMYVSKKIFSFVIVACVALFFGVPFVFASEIEDFFGYSLGNVNGQGDWTQTTNQFEISDSAECDDYCLDSTASADNIYTTRQFSSTTNAIIKINIKNKNYSASPIDQLNVIIWQGRETTQILNLPFRKRTTNTDIVYYNNNNIYFNDNTAQDLYININCDTDTAQIKINGDYETVSLNNNCNYIDTISFQNTNGVDNYINSITWDLFEYEDVFIEELPEYTGNIQVGSEVDLQYNQNTFCFLDQNIDCYVRYNYGYDVIDTDLYLITDTEIIASTTLTNQQYLQGQFLIEEPDEEQVQQYCFLIDDNGDLTSYCPVQITWINNTWCLEENVCSGIATSSTFLYGVQCGMQKTLCWVFSPTPSSVQFLSKTIVNFQQSFPFNLTFDLINSIEETIENSTTTGASFGLPMYSTTTGELYTIYGIDENSFEEALGSSTASTLEDYADMFIWLMTSAIIAFIVIRYAIL